jgi:hypothetical protein
LPFVDKRAMLSGVSDLPACGDHCLHWPKQESYWETSPFTSLAESFTAN